MGPYAVVDYKLTLCRRQSRLQHIYHGQLYARSTLTLCQSRLYPPVRDLGFGLRVERHSEKTKIRMGEGKEKNH